MKQYPLLTTLNYKGAEYGFKVKHVPKSKQSAVFRFFDADLDMSEQKKLDQRQNLIQSWSEIF